MTAGHPDASPDLQRLAQMVLAVLDPIIARATSATAETTEQGACAQQWCPVCAVVAIASGEHHPLAAALAEHAAAVLSLVRTMAGTPATGRPDAHETTEASEAFERPGEPPPQSRSRYQPIPVIVHD